MPTKHALIIGINHYKFMEEEYQLGGCVNDARLMKQMLTQKFGFPPENVTTLYDEQATRAGIRNEMKSVLERLQHNDQFVFHFSGHGHQCRIKSEFTDEGSGKLNCILPHDDSEPKQNSNDRIYREIRESEINRWLQDVALKTPFTTLIFDACHSATITRSAPNKQYSTRFVPEHVRRQVVTIDKNRVQNEQDEATSRKSKGWLGLNKNFVVISGCRDTQQSKEIFFREGSQRFKHGVLTYALYSAFFDLKARTTYRDLFERVSTDVLAWADNQNPQIEGAIDREVFGVDEFEPLNFVPITEVQADSVILDGGAAHGLHINGTWQVYKPFTKTADRSNYVGEVTVTDVDALSAFARITKNEGEFEVGCRCLLKNAGQQRQNLSVYFDSNADPAFSALFNSMKHLVKRSSLVTETDDIELSDVNCHSFKTTEEARQRLGNAFQYSNGGRLRAPYLAVVSNQDRLCMPVQSALSHNVALKVKDNLEKLAKYRNVIALRNPNSQLDVSFNLYRRSPENELTLANGGTAEFLEFEPFVIEIKNNTDKTLFFNILWLSANREISHFYPPRKSSEELVAGAVVRIGDKQNQLSAALSQDFFDEYGSDTIKVIFTTKEVDFRHLTQSGVRSGEQNAQTLSSIENAFIGDQARSETNTEEDWQSINRSIVLRRNEA